MNLGIYYDEFLDIESFKSGNQEEFIAVFEPALKVLGIELPRKKNAYLRVMIECKILPIIQNIIDDKIGIIEASRKIVKIIYELRIEISGLRIFEAIDSETDHLPIGEVRNYWDKQALVKADEKIRAYEVSVRNKVIQVCQSILMKLSFSQNNITYLYYLVDICDLIKREAIEAMEEYHQDKSNDFRTGYLCAFERVISLLNQQAEAFDIDLEDIKLDDIDRTKLALLQII